MTTLKITLSVLFLSLIYCCPATAQQAFNKTEAYLNANKVWVFGDSGGLDFRSGVPVSIKTAMIHGTGGYSSVSDTATGDLLFYSDGTKCWNAQHELMPNGDTLFGNSGTLYLTPSGVSPFGRSTMQGSLIVPVIGDTGKYYLFSLNNEGQLRPNGALFYNVIDMSLDNGKGDIVPGMKNILLDSSNLSEAMIAIPGNYCDIWVLVHALDRTVKSNVYKAYHITAAGIDPVPVTSTGEIGSWVGMMAVSPDRQYIALTGFKLGAPAGVGGLEVARFDPATGMVSNAIELQTAAFGTFACEFSPDNSKLYVSDFIFPNMDLVQFDISNYTQMAITASRELISSGLFSDMKLYNDTIYVLSQTAVGSYLSSAKAALHISAITHPDVSGTGCNFTSNTIAHNFASTITFPNDVALPFSGETFNTQLLDTLHCAGWSQGLTLNPGTALPGAEYTWSNGTDSSSLNVTQAGVYWVRYSDRCVTRTDTFRLAGGTLVQPGITVNGYDLSASQPYPAYQWLRNDTVIHGATNRVFTVTENAKYRVAVTDENGCSDTSEVYEVKNVQVAHGLDIPFAVYPNPSRDYVYIETSQPVNIQVLGMDGRLLVADNDVKKVSVQNLSPGVYLLHIRNQAGILLKTEKLVKE